MMTAVATTQVLAFVPAKPAAKNVFSTRRVSFSTGLAMRE